jgi:hypothetical protein
LCSNNGASKAQDAQTYIEAINFGVKYCRVDIGAQNSNDRIISQKLFLIAS